MKLLGIKNLVSIFTRFIFIFCMIILSILIPGCPPDVTGFAIINLRQYIIVIKNNNISNEFQCLNDKEADNNSIPVKIQLRTKLK